MLKSIAKLFKGKENEVKVMKFEKEQKSLDFWVKVLNIHLEKEELYFLVDYSKNEMVLISEEKLEVNAANLSTQFIFELKEGIVVNEQNIIRVKKLISALYKHYDKDEAIMNFRQEFEGVLNFA